MKITKEYLEEKGFGYETVLENGFSLIIRNLNNNTDVEFEINFSEYQGDYYGYHIDEDVCLDIETVEEFETFLKIMGIKQCM